MRQRMCKLWTNFAKYGNPTPKDKNPLNDLWDPVESTDEDMKHMVLSDDSHLVSNIHGDRIQFWKSVYEKYNGSFLNPHF